MSTTRHSVIWLLAACLFGASSLAAEQMTPERLVRIDAFIEQRMAEVNAPGVALAIVEDGRIVHARGFGDAVIDQMPATPDIAFGVGSVTKPMTSHLLMRLVSLGQLRLDDKVTTYIPWFKTAGVEDYRLMTVRHLLAHRSGLSTYVGNRNQLGQDSADALKLAVRELQDYALVSTPGTRFEYSNANYQILGHILEQAYVMPYESIVETYITGPNGMTDSFVGTTPGPGQTLAQGYRLWLGHPRAFDRQVGRTSLAQGGVRASANDLARYLMALMRPDRAGLGEAAFNEMITPFNSADNGYALGWDNSHMGGHHLVLHSGLNPGFQSMAGFSPESGFAVVVLVNANSSFGQPSVGNLLRGVVDLSVGLEPPTATPYWLDRTLFLTIVMLPIVLLLLILRFWRRAHRGHLAMHRGHIGPGWVVVRLILPSVLLISLAMVLWFVVPKLNGVPMRTLRLYNPDIGWLMTASVALAIIWAVVRPWLRWRAALA